MTLTDITELAGLALIVLGVALWLGIPIALVVAGVLVIAWSIALAWSGRDRSLDQRRAR